MRHELLGGRELIHQSDLPLRKAIQHRLIEEREHLLLPQREVVLRVEPEVPRELLHQIVPELVREVPLSNLRRHVPPIERTASVLDAPHVQNEGSHNRKGVPLQLVLLKHFLLSRVGDVHYQGPH